MIIGKLVYSGSKLSLVNLFNDTCLWELAASPSAANAPMSIPAATSPLMTSCSARAPSRKNSPAAI